MPCDMGSTGDLSERGNEKGPSELGEQPKRRSGEQQLGKGGRRLVVPELRLKEVCRPGDRVEGVLAVVQQQCPEGSELERHLEVEVVRTG